MFGEVAEALLEYSDHELDARIRDLELERRRIESELAAAIAVADARQLNAVDGHRSMSGYLRATCNWSPGEVARFRSAAVTCDRHPVVGDAWMAGRIGGAQVAALSALRSRRSVGERFAEFVPVLVEHAESLSHREFELVLQRLVRLADADGTFDERREIDARSATATHVDGSLFVHATGGDASTTAEFLAILRRFEDAEFRREVDARAAAEQAGGEIEPFRSASQRRFDALIEMARTAARPRSDRAASEPLVSVLVDHTTFGWVLAHSGLGSSASLDGVSIDPFTGLPTPSRSIDDLLGSPAELLDRRCETADGVPLRATDVLRAMLSGHIRRVVLGAERRVVDLGRAQRVFTGAARDAAMLLATTCEHPGCLMPASWCQIDHVAEWCDDGATDQDNAGTRCGAHNREKHRRRRRAPRSESGRAYTLRADGTIILPVGARPPALPDVGSDHADDGLDAERDRDRDDESRIDGDVVLIEAARARLRLACLVASGEHTF